MKGGGEKDEEFEAKITAFFQGKEAYHQEQLQIKVGHLVSALYRFEKKQHLLHKIKAFFEKP